MAIVDRLLDTEGIMHLHLGHSGTRELLFLVQYSDHVVFLEMSDHAHFANDPPGTQLRVLHENKIVELEKSLAEAKQAKADALGAKVRSSLKLKS